MCWSQTESSKWSLDRVSTRPGPPLYDVQVHVARAVPGAATKWSSAASQRTVLTGIHEAHGASPGFPGRREGRGTLENASAYYVRFILYTVLPYPGFQNTTWCVCHGGELATKVTKGGAQVVWIRNLRATCCSQFDSNT